MKDRWRTTGHAQAVAEDGQDIAVLCLDRLDQRIDECEVPADVVGSVEQHTNGWPGDIPALLEIVCQRRRLRKRRMVDAIFWQRRGRLKAVASHEESIGEEQQ